MTDYTKLFTPPDLRPEGDITRVVTMAEPSLYGSRRWRDGRDAAETALKIKTAGINWAMRASLGLTSNDSPIR